MTTATQPHRYTHRLYEHCCGHPLYMEVAYIGGQGYVLPTWWSQRPISRNSVSACPGCNEPLPRSLAEQAEAVATDILTEVAGTNG